MGSNGTDRPETAASTPSSDGGEEHGDRSESADRPEPTTAAGIRTDTAAALGLTGLFVVTLWPVYVLESVGLWLLWGASMVLLSGATLVVFNR